MTPNDYYDQGMRCADLGQWDKATDAFRHAHEMVPECPVITRFFSMGLLIQGKFREGQALFERRFEHPIPEGIEAPFGLTLAPRIRDCYPRPYWDGLEDITGKTIYVFNEGGHGDIIQNIRYLPQLKRLCGKLVLETSQETYRLLQNSIGVDEVIERGSFSQMLFFRPKKNLAEIAKADYVVSIHSLLYYFDPDLTNTPWHFPYISPQPSDSKAIQLIKDCTAKKKIGIVWAGKPGHGNDSRRSTFAKNFLPLKDISGAQLFSLQKGDMIRQFGNLDEDIEVLDLIDIGPLLLDFNDTAAVLKELDYLVSVDTSVVHLAGALDIPVRTLLPERNWAEWRWQKEWYKSQKKFYQKTDGDWKGLLKEVVDDISKG